MVEHEKIGTAKKKIKKKKKIARKIKKKEEREQNKMVRQVTIDLIEPVNHIRVCKCMHITTHYH